MALRARAPPRAAPRRSARRPAAAAPATRPSATTAALEPRPRSRGIRSAKSNDAARGRRVDRERAHAEVRLVDVARRSSRDLELVPERERGARDVEAGAEVRGRRRRADANRHRSIAAGSFEAVPRDDADDPLARRAPSLARARRSPPPRRARRTRPPRACGAAPTLRAAPRRRPSAPSRPTARSPRPPRRGGSARRSGSPRRPCRRATPDSTGCRRGSAPAAARKPRAYAFVLPPPPYGSVSTSGRPPSCSTISAAAVIWPSMRSGFVELTMSEPGSAASSSAARYASVNEPSTSTMRAADGAHLDELRARGAARRDDDHRLDARRARHRRRTRRRCCRSTRRRCA